MSSDELADARALAVQQSDQVIAAAFDGDTIGLATLTVEQADEWWAALVLAGVPRDRALGIVTASVTENLLRRHWQ